MLKLLRTDRPALVSVVASLVAIASVAYLVFTNHRDARLADIRSHGISLVRLLSELPVDDLVPEGRRRGVLRILRHNAAASDLAYVSIVGPDGVTLNDVVAEGVLVPAPQLPAEPAAWFGERRVALPGNGLPAVEFYAPLVESGELRGFVRLGYRYPSRGLDAGQVSFLAMVSLPVFLLVPLFYWLLRAEVRPVRMANQQITKLMTDDGFRRLEVVAGGELGDFMQRFNAFIDQANARIHSLESDQARLITSSKLLAYRKTRVETVLETLPEAVMILDETGSTTFANEKLAAMFDTTCETVLSQPAKAWCDNPDILSLLSKYQTGSNARAFNETIRFNLESLNERCIATRTFPLFAPNGQSTSIGTLIIFRDETREALARQARADFVAHLSHELKSPLNVLGMYSESLLSEVGKSEEFRVEAANVISEEVSRLSSLISGLLSMTQIESGSLTPDRSLVKLRDVATAAFEEAKGLARDKDYEFHFDVPRELSPVYVDKDLIRIAITNLLSNAVKYNRDGGEVRLTIEETEDATQIRVADSGIGISEEEAARIFDKFFRSSDERVQLIGGHGLGLALARQIVELHQGTLSLNHDRPEGAEFIINLWKDTTTIKQAI